MSDHYLRTNHMEVLSNFHYKLSSRTPSTLKTAVHNRLQSEIKCAIAQTSFPKDSILKLAQITHKGDFERYQNKSVD